MYFTKNAGNEQSYKTNRMENFKMKKEFDIEKYSYQDKFIKRRIYQLKNHEEVYKNYNYTHDLERDIALLELGVMELCNHILNYDPNNPDNDVLGIDVEAIDMLWGRMDTEAVALMARCDTDKQLAAVHAESY